MSAMQSRPALDFTRPAAVCCLTARCSVIVLHNPGNGRVSIWSQRLCHIQPLIERDSPALRTSRSTRA